MDTQARHIRLTVDQEQPTMRIDTYLTQQLPAYSRSFFQRLAQQKSLTVNNAPISKPSLLIKPGDLIEITIASKPAISPSNIAQKIPKIEIIHHDEHFFVINKPAGLIVHKKSATATEPTLVDWLLMTYADTATIGDHERPGIVHRLDKDTSGLMLIARTNYGHMTLGALFAQREVKKTYLAVVHGHPDRTGNIELPIGRHPTHRYKMTTFKPSDTRGSHCGLVRDAHTDFTVLNYFDTSSLIELKPRTGRTHQIRVHCAAMGHSLVGDAVYGQPSPHITRHALHASAIEFTFNGSSYSFTAPAPQDFMDLVQDKQEIS